MVVQEIGGLFSKKTQVATNVDDAIAMERLARKRAIYTNSSGRERHAMWSIKGWA